MSDGEDSDPREDSAGATDGEDVLLEVSPDALEERLQDASEAIEIAGTEAALDDIETTVEGVAAALEEEGDQEDDEDPDPEMEAAREQLETVRDEIEAARGPYASDVLATLRDAIETVSDSEWTELGTETMASAVGACFERVAEETALEPGDPDEDAPADALGGLVEVVETADLDADADGETLERLVEATDELSDALDGAEVWDDLSVVQMLEAEGFYDRLTPRNRKDFPPELSAVRVAEAEKDPERILLALEYLDSDFMEENSVAALKRLGAPEAFDELLAMAEKRDVDAIEALGKIGPAAAPACETLHGYIEDESNPPLQKAVLRALGEIGASDSTQPVANRLVAEDPDVRSQAARALGRIGDTRAIAPLGDVLSADRVDSVRAAAAWALNAIGTQTALEVAAAHTDDRVYLVEAEAERAADALSGREDAELAS